MADKSEDKSEGPQIATVDDYPERPYDEARAKDADTPREQVDQIADYHEKNPTLDTSGPEHDPEVQAELASRAAEQATEPQEPPQRPQESSPQNVQTEPGEQG